jgi:ribosomal protein S3AE
MVTKRQRGKKKWFTIVAEPEFGKQKLGESLVYAAEDLVGKKLHVNLMTLMNDPRKQNVTLSFAIMKVEGTTSIAYLVGYKMSSSHLKRVIRKSIRRIDDSFIVQTKDNVKFRIKPLLVTRFKTNKGIASALRKQTKETLQNLFTTMKAHDAFQQIISNKLQITLKNDLKKIYPLALTEIRVLQKL